MHIAIVSSNCAQDADKAGKGKGRESRVPPPPENVWGDRRWGKWGGKAGWQKNEYANRVKPDDKWNKDKPTPAWIKCFKCQQKGHEAKDCRNPRAW